MTRFLKVFPLCFLLGALAYGAQSEKEPRFDLLEVKLDVKFAPDDNRMDAVADLHLRVQDSTNYVGLRLNGNLTVSQVTDDAGVSLRYVQDSGDLATVKVHLGAVLGPGDEKRLKLNYSGLFAPAEFDFNRAVGMEDHSIITSTAIELFAPAFWYPMNADPFDRSRYELNVVLPREMRVVTATDLVESGVKEDNKEKTLQFRTAGDTMPLSLVAGVFRTTERETTNGTKIQIFLRNPVPDEEAALKSLVKSASFVESKFSYLSWPAVLTVAEVSNTCRDSLGMPGVVILRTKDFGEGATKTREFTRRFALQKWLFPLRFASARDAWIPEGLSRLAAAFNAGEGGGDSAFFSEMRICALDALKFPDAETVHRGFRLGLDSEKYASVVRAKGAWVFCMLRNVIGATEFDKFMRDLAELSSKGDVDTAALMQCASKAFGKDLSWFFPQWLDTVFLPTFSADYLIFRNHSGGYVVEGKVNQVGNSFRMPLVVGIDLKEGIDRQTLDMVGEVSRFHYEIKPRPIRVNLDPDYRMLRKSPELQGEVFILRGDEAFEEGDYPKAIELLQQAIGLDNRNSLAFYKMGLVFMAQGNFNTAVETFRDALNGSQKPEWVVALSYLGIGKCYDILGQRERAIAEYNKAINTKDDSRGAVTEAEKLIKDPFVPAGTLQQTAGSSDKTETEERGKQGEAEKK